jgi:hypothetical protein
LYEILHAVGNDALKQENNEDVFQLLRQAFGFELRKHEELLKQVQNTKVNLEIEFYESNEPIEAHKILLDRL